MGLRDHDFQRSYARNILRTSLALAVLGLVVVGLVEPAGEPARAAAGINQTINYQGRLLTNTGAVVADGNYNMRFKIYQDGDGVLGGGDESLKWTETRQNSASQGVVVKNGYFSVNLGSITAFGSNVDWNQDTLWLSTDIAGTGTGGSPTYDGEMSPFKRLASAVYALNAGELGGLTSAQYVQLAQGVQTANITTNPAIFINATSGSSNLVTLQTSSADVFDVTSAGNILLGSNADKTISVSTSGAATAGRALQITAGGGGSGSGSAGGALTLQGGAGGGTTAAGGNVVIDGGAAAGASTDGTISIGTNHASSITVGNVTNNPNIAFNGSGTFGTTTGNVSLNGNATVATGKSLTVAGGVTSLTGVSGGASAVLTVQGAASQTANVLQVQDSTGANINAIDPGGNQESLGSIDTPWGGIGKYGNLATFSEQINNGVWSLSNVAVTSNDAGSNPAPDGNTTAEKLVSSASNATVTQTVTNSTTGNWTFSMWVKTNSGTQPVQLEIDSTGGTPTTGTPKSFTATTTWQRFYVTQNFTGSPTAIKPTLIITNNSATVAAWGAQLVIGSTPEVYVRETTGTSANNTGLAVNGNMINFGTSQSSSVIVSSGASSNSYIKNYIVGTGGVSANDVVVLVNDGGTSAVTDTTTARDIRVMGVATGAGASGSGTSIAIGGNFQVTADAGAVAIGDQLVTSTTAGQVTVDNSATAGIVGYATTPKSAGGVGSSGLVGVYILPRTGVTNPNFTGSVSIQGSSALSLGKVSSVTATELFYNSGGSGSITLTPANPGSSTYTLTLPAENGTICTSSTTGVCATAGTGYILNQSSSPGSAQIGNFNISGTGIAGTALQAPSFDVASAGTLSVGTGTATDITVGKTAGTGTITLGQSTASNTVNIGTATGNGNTQTVNIGSSATSGSIATVKVGDLLSTSTTTIQGGTGSGAIALNTGTNGSINLNAGGTGNINLVTNSSSAGTLIKPSSGNDSATAFQVQSAIGRGLLTVDTSALHVLVTDQTSSCTGTSGYGMFCVGNTIGGAGGGVATSSNIINSINTSSQETVNGQKILIKDTSSAINNINYGLYVDGSTGNTNASQTLTGIYANDNSAAPGNIIQLQSSGADAFTVSNAGVTNVGTLNVTGNVTSNLESTGYYDNGIGGIGQFANLLNCSEVFDPTTCTATGASPTWSTTTLTVTSDSVAGPDGQTSADTLAGTTPGSSDKVLQNSATAVGAVYTFSVWLKTASGTQPVGLRISGSTGGSGSLNTVTATTSWQRFSVTQDTNACGTSCTGNVRVIITPDANNSGSPNAVYAWGAQLVAGSLPLVYSRATGSTVTSSAGVVSNGGLFVSAINASDKPLVVQAAPSQSGDLFQLLPSTSNSAPLARFDSGGDLFVAADAGGVKGVDTQSAGLLNLGNANATTINVGTNNAAHTIGIGSNSSSAQAVTIGSTNTTSATIIQGGTGNVSINTGTGSGTTGSISLTTGNSSGGASGNITIDAGTNVPTGSGVENKTFESTVEGFGNWFGTSSVATSTSQARTGTHSLAVTESAAFWGAIEGIPGAATVTPGHVYQFSAWARAGTAGEAIGFGVNWDGGGVSGPTFTGTDNTSGWTQISGTAVAPAGATDAYLDFSGGTGVNTHIQYFDDVTVTDITSTNAPAISIGSVNAQAVTIGNTNQTTATLLQGGGGGVNISASTDATISLGTTNPNVVTIGSTSNGNTLTFGQSTLGEGINIGNGTVATGNTNTINVGTSATGTGKDIVKLGSLNGASATTIQAGTGNINLKSNNSNISSPNVSVQQAGSGDSTIELQDSAGVSSSFYLSNDASNNNALTVNSNTSATFNAAQTPAQAQSPVSNNSTGNGTTIVAQYGSNNTAGNMMVVAVSWDRGAGTKNDSLTCSDDHSDSFSSALVRTDVTQNEDIGVCYAANIIGGTRATVTATFGQSQSFRAINIHEYSGVAKVNPLDASAPNNATATTATDSYTSTVATTTQAGDLIFGYVQEDNGGSPTLSHGTGFTTRSSGNYGGGSSPFMTEDKVQSAAGSVAATWTSTSGDPYQAYMLAFKPGNTTNSLTDTNSKALFTLSQTGALKLQNVVDSTGAFQVQNAAGNSLLNVDTSGSTVSVGSTGSLALASIVNIASSSGAAQTVTVGSTNSSSATTIQGGTGNINLNTNQAGAGTIVKTVTTNSTTAFQVQNAAGTAIFNVDTANSKVGTPDVSAASTASLSLTIKTGDATGTGGTSNSGDITIDSGGSTNGTKGSINIGTTNAAAVNIGRVAKPVNVAGNLVVGSGGTITNGTAAVITSTSTLNSAHTGSQYGFDNETNFNPSGGSITNVYGEVNYATLTGSALAATGLYGSVVGINTTSGYTGQITAGYGLNVAAPSIAGSLTIPTYTGISVTGITSNSGNTSGTIDNYQIKAGGNTAGAGSGGTLNNYGVAITQPSGTGGNTSNYGLYISGNGTSSGTGVNYSIYNSSTAASYFAGDVLEHGTSATALQVQNASGNAELTVDSSGNNVVLGKAATINTALQFNNSAGGASHTVGIAGPISDPASSYTLNLPSTAPSTNQCLMSDPTTATTLVFSNCAGTGNTLQTAYTNSSTPADITLTTGKNLTVTSPDVATDPSMLINLQCTTCSSNGGRFAVQNAGTDVFTVNPNSGGIVAGTNITASGAATGTTATTSGTGTNTTTVTLTGSAFANNDVIFIDNAGQDFYTRIVSGGGSSTLTVSPAVSFDNAVTVTKYTVQNIGATSSDYTTLNNRFFQGYFLGGVVTGTGSTTLSDQLLKSTGALNVTAAAASTWSTGANALTVASGGTSSWTNTSGNLTIKTATSGTLALDAAGALTVGGTNATSIGLGNTSSNIATTINGTAVIKPTSGHDSTTAFQVQNAAAQTLLNVDTTNSAVSAGSGLSAVGDTHYDVVTTTNPGGQNGIITRRITTTSAGTLKSLSFFLGNGGSANYQVAIYSDTSTCPSGSSCPGALIASTSTNASTPNQWNTAAVSASLSATTNYWIAIEYNVSDSYITPTGSEHYWFFEPGEVCTGGTVGYGVWPTTLANSCGSTPGPPFTSSTPALLAYANIATGSDGYALSTDLNGHVAIGSGSATNATDTLVVKSISSESALNVTGYATVSADSSRAFAVTTGSGATLFEADTAKSRVYVNANYTSSNLNGVVNIGKSNGTDYFDLVDGTAGIVNRIDDTGQAFMGTTSARTGDGTVSNSASSATVTGSGTLFTYYLKVGDTLTIDPTGVNVACTVAAIASDTSLTCSSNITSAHSSLPYSFTGAGNSDLVNLQANGNISLGDGGAHSLYVRQATSGAGSNLTMAAGQGASGQTGGNLLLQAGANGTSSGTPGAVVVKANGGDSTTAFQIQNSSGTSFFTADSTKNIVTANDLDAGSASSISGNGRLFSDGFENGNATVWAGGVGGTGGTTTTNETGTVRNGKYSAKIITAGNNGYVQTTINASSTVFARTYFNVTTAGNPTPLMDLGTAAIGSGGHIYISLGASGNLCYTQTLNGSGGPICSATAPSTSTWHKLETKVTISATVGVLQVWLDGTLVTTNSNAINLSGQNFGVTNLSNFSIGNGTTSTSTTYFDDIALDTVATGDSSSLNVNDTLRVSGTSTFGGTIAVVNNSNAAGNGILSYSNGNGIGVYGSSNGYVGVLGQSNTGTSGLFQSGSGSNTNPTLVAQQNGSSTADLFEAQQAAGGSAVVFSIGSGGATLIKTPSNTATAFRVQNTGGENELTIDTSADRVIVGTGSTGETTAKLFVLDSGTAATDPTGVAGAMYYNSSLGQFRCYNNGTWYNCIGVAGDYQRQYPFYSTDFEGAGNANQFSPWFGQAIGGGNFNADASQVTANHPGVIKLTGGSSTGDGYEVLTSKSSQTWLFGGGENFETVFNLQTLTNASIRMGYWDTNPIDATSAVANGVYVDISSAGVITGKTAKASSTTSTGTTSTLSTSTWYHLKISVNSANTQEDFYILQDNGTQVWHNCFNSGGTGGCTASSNFPAVAVSNGVAASSTGTSTQTIVDMDYMAMWVNRQLVR